MAVQYYLRPHPGQNFSSYWIGLGYGDLNSESPYEEAFQMLVHRLRSLVEADKSEYLFEIANAAWLKSI
jgi:hypothetical protein